MIRTVRPIGAFLAGLLAAVALAPSAGAAQSLDSLVHSRLGRLSSGAAAGVVREGEVIYMKGWGTPSHQTSEALEAGVLFPWPAFTEILLAATVRALDAAGVVSADAPIGRYLPELAEPLRPITLDQLLRHTAGLADAPTEADDSAFAALESLGPEVLIAPPGTIFSQSRYSYPLAARALERAAGMPLAELIETALFAPLGMERSTFDREKADRVGVAAGYLATPDTASPWLGAAPVERVGGLPVPWTNVPEIVQFLTAWMGGGLAGGGPAALPPDPERPRMDQVLVDGLVRGQYQLLTELERNTRSLGHSVVLRAYPEAGTAVVVWANATGPLGGGMQPIDPFGAASLPWDVAAFMTERLLGPDVPVRVTEEVPDTMGPAAGPESVPLWAWAGRYVNGDRLIVLRPPEDPGVEADLAFFDGTRDLPLERLPDGTVLARLPEDGRPAVLLRLVRDDAGRRYVIAEGKAFRLVEPSGS